MNFSSLSAGDKQLAIAGGLVVLVSIISFVDPSGSWGGVMALSLLGGLFALFLVLQPQIAPSTKLPMTKGLSMLVAGALSVAGFAIAMLSYLAYITRNLNDIYVLIMIVGLVAAAFLAWKGWTAYQHEPKSTASTPPPAASEPPAAPPAA